ncbi:DUF5977 domain-containing protein [Cloacibacterium sp.]|uniref:DUF5977 domain-containing protein n=1 Tax=Cloacibacterium sp. TaxID=1913682 RepID=UPI0039E6267E
MMRKITYTLMTFFTSILFLAQNRELPINIQSPNASSLGKYGDLSMDLNTGRANVSVPLYQLEEGGIPMVISMSYDTGGVRVNDVPGWVGQNWALQAGGVVTRSVRGKASDELNWNSSSYGYTNDWKGYYYYKDALNNSNWNSKSYLESLATYATSYPDYEPDVFTFNFMGYSGKFFLGQDGEWKVSSSNNLKVIIDINDKIQPNNYYYVAYGNYNNMPFPKVLGKITMIDDQGNRFIFGDLVNQNSIELTFQNFFNQIDTPIVASAWYLTKVYNKYNQLVYDLNYERGDYLASFYNRNGFQQLSLTTGYYAGGGCSYGSTDGNNVYANGNLIIPSYLKKITTYSSKQILFNSTTNNSLKYGANDTPIIQTYDKFRQDMQSGSQSHLWNSLDDSYFYYIRRDQNLNVLPSVTGGNLHIYPYLEALKWRKLTGINILSSDQSALFSATFDYNDNVNARLRLDKITINNFDSKNKQAYSFDYNNFDSLPLFTSNNIDHFGYYKSTPFVLDYNNPSIHEASRATDPNTVAYGTLSKITYPTKGYTKFLYEPHTYSQYVGNDLMLKQENGVIGGVRIKSIINYDGVGAPEIKKFYYVTDLQTNKSSGILLQKNNYFMPDYKMPTTVGGTTIYQTYFNISPIVYLSNLMGSTIEYPTVIEDDGKGTIVNHYSSFNDYPDFKNDTYIAQDRNKFDPHTEYGYKRGKIKQKQYFDNLGNKIRQEDYSYQDNNNQNVRGFSYTSIAPCSGATNAPIINGSSYNIYFSDFDVISKKVTNYFSGNKSVEETESYEYAKNDNFGDNFLTSKTISTSDKVVKESFIYPFQKSGSIYTSLLDKRYLSVIQKDTYLNAKNIAREISSYDFKPILNQSTTILASSQNNQINLNSNEEFNKVSYDLYDDVGNILQYTTQSNIPVSLVWGYNKTRVIAKIEGATYSQIKSYISEIVNTSNDAMITSNYNNDDLISKLNDFRTNSNLKDFQITAYTYFKGGIGLKTIIHPSGQKENYVYDNRNRLQKILDSNNKIVKEWDYNYSSLTVSDIFLSTQKKQTFTRNNCGSSAIGGVYTYIVPDGKYISYSSQAAADQMAQNELDNNGQNTANANSICTPFNCPISFYFSGGGYVTVQNNNYYKVTLSFDTGSNSNNLPWTTGVLVANIQGTCTPLTDYNSYNGQIYYTIKTNGDIILRSHSGVLPNNTIFNYPLVFPIN